MPQPAKSNAVAAAAVAAAKPAAKRAPPSKTLRTVQDLAPDPRNANKGTHRGRALVETSVRRYGFGRSVLVDKHGVLIAGNKTVEAAGTLGNPNVRVIQSTGKELVVVQRTDLDLATDAEAQELAVADNRSSEAGLQWDAEVLANLEKGGAQLQQFWRPGEWEKLLAEGGVATLASADEIPEMQLQAFEEYNYVVLVFRNSQDWHGAVDVLGLRKEAVTLGATRKIGLGRVLDGAAVVERLRSCESKLSSRPAAARRPSAKKR